MKTQTELNIEQTQRLSGADQKVRDEVQQLFIEGIRHTKKHNDRRITHILNGHSVEDAGRMTFNEVGN